MEYHPQWEDAYDELIPRRRSRKRSAARAVFFTLLALALLCAGALLFLSITQKREDEARRAIVEAEVFRAGVSVGGVDVGGLGYAQARELLAAKELKSFADIGFRILSGNESYVVDRSCFIIESDAEEQLDAAFGLARDGSLEALEMELADIAAAGRSFDVSYSIRADEAKLRAIVQSVAAGAAQAPTEAGYSLKAIPLDEETGGYACYNLALSDGHVDSSGAAYTDLRDLRFDFVEGQSGYGVDEAALMETLLRRTQGMEWGDVEAPLGEIAPSVSIESLKERLVLRAAVSTKYSRSSDRTFNIKKAAGRIYGTVLQPGETFSHNTVLGDRTLEGGWRLAPAVIDGGANHEDQAGGGVCQTSTTLYQAVLRADLEVVHRQGHSIMSSYADGGMDCTIADSRTGNIDFKFKNNTAAPIYIFMWLDTEERYCHAEIFGEPFPESFDEIRLYSELVETIPPTADVYTPRDILYEPYWQLRNEAKEGYSYDAYKIYMKDGQELERKRVDNTVYRMHPRRFYVWPGWMGQPLDPLYQVPYEKDA